MNDSGSGVTQQLLPKPSASTVTGLLHKRSGPEHDLTGWLDDIPPRLAFRRDRRHGFNSLPFSDGKKEAKIS